jgi:ribosomal-protein-alanine N-acetyltransferase
VSGLRLATERLLIRPFVAADLPAIHRVLDRAFGDGSKVNDEQALQERQSWLQWAILSEQWFPKLNQPPYGDRAITLKSSGEVIGAVGFAPSLDAFHQIPELRNDSSTVGFNTTALGLFWAVDPDYQKQGYATEAARAMISYAFEQLRLNRIIATTTYTNVASQAVMRKVGMTLTRNPLPEPPWLQIVGLLDNPG